MSDNTPTVFSDKWHNNPQAAFAATRDPSSEIHQWILGRNGFGDTAALQAFLATKQRVLDAGCGNGRVTALLRENSPAATEIVGIDLVASEIARKNLEQYKNITTLQKDLLQDLSDLGAFDFIYCQEVLHHTKDPRQAFVNLSKLLRPKGEIAIYVYKKKAPMREYCDDYIRDVLAPMPYEDAMKVCRQITEFGKALSEQTGTVTVPALDVLEIPAGEYPMQRLLYHFFFKCFWNTALPHQDNVTINYDWYHPQLASRHTLPEVRQWLADQSLDVTREFTDPYGITVWGRRR
jgi:SAM-dependent methyltransferase